MTATEVIYFVNSGPDRSHLVNSKPFNKLKEAILYASELPETPMGLPRPYVIEGHYYNNAFQPFNVVVKKTSL